MARRVAVDAPLRLELATPELDTPSSHAAYFGCPIRLGAPRNALVLTAADLELSLDTHNPVLLRALVPYLRVDTPTSPGEEVERVRSATGGVTGTGLPTVPGSARHMRAIRRWVSLQEDGVTAAFATQDAPLVQTGGVAIPYAPYPQSLAQEDPGMVFSWVHNNIWDTNFPAQQAFDHIFRYSVAWEPDADSGSLRGDGPPHPPEKRTGPVLGMRTAAVGSRPLTAVRARGDALPQPEPSCALLALDDPRVRVVGLTVPEPGHVLVRLQSFAEEPIECRATTGFELAEATSADYLGATGDPLPTEGSRTVLVPIPQLGTVAVLLTCAPATALRGRW
ncbi:Arabinose-binding domain of AraC transcription regulator, N-term [Actinomadura madurae]|nr:Arabinose-binding domain of AraC transcription regulator, N-term [Actinomadura madurae]